ncbi:unnamed protein product [Lampetra fluviatilis]
MWVLVGFAFKFLCLVSCDIWPVSAASELGHCKTVKKNDGAMFLVCVEGHVVARRGSVATLPCTVSLLVLPAIASCRWPTVTATWTVGGEDGDVIYDGRWGNGSRLRVVASGYVDGDKTAEMSLVIAGVTEGDVATSYYCHPFVHCRDFSVSLGTSHAIRLVWQDPEPPASHPGHALVLGVTLGGSLALVVTLTTLATLAAVVVTRRRRQRRRIGMGSSGCAEPAHEDCQQCAVYTTLRQPLPPPTYDVIAGSSSVTELRGRAPLMPPNGGVASAKALEVARPRDQGLQYVELVMDGNEGGAIRSSGEKVHYSHIRA